MYLAEQSAYGTHQKGRSGRCSRIGKTSVQVFAPVAQRRGSRVMFTPVSAPVHGEMENVQYHSYALSLTRKRSFPTRDRECSEGREEARDVGR